MLYKIFEFKPKMEFIVDRDFKSVVVDIVHDKTKDGEELPIIVYKKWLKHKQRWAYYAEDIFCISFAMDLWSRELCVSQPESYRKIMKKYKVGAYYKSNSNHELVKITKEEYDKLKKL